MSKQILEQEFAPYRVAIALLEVSRQAKRPVSEFNLIKVAKDDGEDPKVLQGLAKAFGSFFSDKIDDVGNFITDPFRSPQERAAKASIRVVKYLQNELDIKIHSIPPKYLRLIMEGIAYDCEDESIQSKWEKLLARCMAGEYIRYEFLEIVSKLNPVDARILDLTYKKTGLLMDEVLKYAKIKDRPIELSISLEKISKNLKLCEITGNMIVVEMGDSNTTKNMFRDYSSIKSCTITSPFKKGDDPIYVQLSFSYLGYGFMECVTRGISKENNVQ